MADMQPLLASKFELPLSGQVVVSRPRLFARLTTAVQSRLTTLVSPAGWGKTQLLLSWIESGSAPHRVAWVTLDTAENDPVRFWNYVLAALRTTTSPDQGAALRGLSGASVSTTDWRVFLAMVVNALAELDDPVILILEGADELRDNDVLEQLDFLIVHAPTTLRIVMTGRSIPNLPPETIRAWGHATQLRPSTLAFTASETSDLLRSYDLDIPVADQAALLQKTQGWVSGLQMAMLSAKDTAQPPVYLSQFAGDEPLVADYLFAEVLSNQKPDVQRFLLLTSIVSAVTPALAAALTESPDAREILEDIERRNLFTATTTQRRDEFAYAPVFRTFLQNHLARDSAKDVSGLHLIASQWFGSEGRVVESIEHAALARDRANLVATFGEHWLSLFLDGEYGTLQRLMDSMDPDLTATSAEILAVQALVHLADGNTAIADRDSSLSRRQLSRGDVETASLVTAASLFELQRARTAVDAQAAENAWNRFTEFPGIDSLKLADDAYALALLHLAATEFAAGWWKESQAHVEEAVSLARRTGREYITLGCLGQLGQLALGRNQVSRAAQFAQEALEIADRRGWTHTSEAAGSWEILAWIHQLRGELHEADRCLDHAEDAARRNQPVISAVIHCDQGLVLGLRGDQGAALAAVREAAIALEDVQARFVFWPFIYAEQVRILSAMGDADGARQLFDELASVVGRTMQIILAESQMLLDQGQEDDALAVLEPALAGRAEGPHEDRIQALLMAAVAHHRCGRRPATRSNIHAALELGRRERLRLPFMRMADSVAPLLRAYSLDPSTGPRTAYLDSVLQVLPQAVPAPIAGLPPEQLSERELEVLGLLPDLMTVPELAVELFISVNTVKAHLKSIYRKLGAPNRRSAVSIARAHGLL